MKKVIFTIVVILMIVSLSASDKLKENLEVRLKSGIFVPAKTVKSVYGEDAVYSAEAIAWLIDDFGISLAVQNYSNSIDTIDLESRISITPITLNFIYRSYHEKISPYYSFGIGLFNATTKRVIEGKEYCTEDSAIGLSSKCGIKIDHFFFELSYSSSQLSLDLMNNGCYDVNVGGLAVCAGISFGR